MKAEPPQIGQWCWAISTSRHPLPLGLNERTLVRVIRPTPVGRGNRYLTMDECDRSWELHPLNLDAGYSLHIDGRRVHEGAEDFGRHLIRQIWRARATPLVTQEDGWARDRLIEHWLWLLERNGWDLAILGLRPNERIGLSTRPRERVA